MSRLRRTRRLQMDFQRGKFKSVQRHPSLTKHCRWDLLGQQIVGQLADSLTTALNQAITALVDNLNPIAKAKAVAGLASGLIHGNEKEKANEAPSTNGNADAPAADRHISSPAATRPKDADDPAYNQAARDLPFFELVNGTFIGDDGGIDWDKAKGEPGKANQSIVFAAKMLQSSKTAFESLATSAEPSKTYSGALATACEVCYRSSLRYPERSDNTDVNRADRKWH